MLLLLGVIGLGLRRARYADLGRLASAVVLAILANAFVCGALSNPHDRYGARMAWLAPFVLLSILCRALARAHLPSSGTKATPDGNLPPQPI